jgi:tetratricopeptide (TPR) repeat protein
MLALGHSELVAQHQDLGILPPRLTARQAQQRHSPGNNQEDQSQAHKPTIIARPAKPGPTSRVSDTGTSRRHPEDICRLPRGQGWAYQMLAAIAVLDGRPLDARQLAARAEETFRGTGDIRGLGWALRCRADAHRDLGEGASAAGAYDTALSALGEAGDLRGIALIHVGVAGLRERHGDPRGAAIEYQQALSTFRDIGDTRRVGDTLLALGCLLAATGNASKARAYYQQSLAAYQSIQDQHGTSDATTRLRQRIPGPRRALPWTRRK